MNDPPRLLAQRARETICWNCGGTYQRRYAAYIETVRRSIDVSRVSLCPICYAQCDRPPTETERRQAAQAGADLLAKVGRPNVR